MVLLVFLFFSIASLISAWISDGSIDIYHILNVVIAIAWIYIVARLAIKDEGKDKKQQS